MKRADINQGDRITFKAATRYSFQKATRVVKGFDHLGRPLVQYNGYTDFIVCWPEVIKILPAKATTQ